MKNFVIKELEKDCKRVFTIYQSSNNNIYNRQVMDYNTVLYIINNNNVNSKNLYFQLIL